MVSQNKFTEFFSQWGQVGTTVAWGNNRKRVIIASVVDINNKRVTILNDLSEHVVPMDQLYPLFCEVCQHHSFIGLILSEGCQHRQCPNCMEQYENKCGFGCQ